MVCPNCSTETDSRFCPSCGQRMDVKRLTFKEGFQDFWSRIYGFDTTFPRTMRDFTLRPGVAAKRYINRNRILYYGPVGYYFLMITVMFLVASILGIDFNEVMMGRSRELGGEPATGGALEAQKRLQMLILENFKMFTFTLVAFQAFSLKLFFRNSGYNLLEHSVLAFFTMGHMYWLTIIDLILTRIFGTGINFGIAITINILFYAYGAMGLYDYQPKVKVFIKGIFSFLTGYLMFIVLITSITVAYFILDPEMRELVRPNK
jgi:hypothetical protein